MLLQPVFFIVGLVMVGVAVAVTFPLLEASRRRLGRVEGRLLPASYLALVATLLVRSTGAG